MPREVVRAPGHDRERSLGHLAVAWIEFFVRHGPGDVQGQPVAHGDEFYGFIVDCYALDDKGRRLYDSGFLSRPKGCDKSGLGARFALLEALGPCRFDRWATGGEVYRDPWGLGFEYVYQPGEPMGRPVKVPYVRIMATEEGQTGNVYDSIHHNLTDEDCPLSQVPGVDAGLTRVVLPDGGEITPSTASSASKDGGKETFVVFDETHLYVLVELRRMYATVTRNLAKRQKSAGTWFLETTTWFEVGAGSVAEKTFELARQIREGLVRRARLLFDHRWGECENLADEEALRGAIREAYGEALEWNSEDAIVDQIFDPRNEPADSRRYFLNAPAGAVDAWIQDHEWAGRCDATKVVADRDVVVLGFDGSRQRVRGVTDATALIGCRVHDGHLFEVGVWEQPQGPAGNGWEAPRLEIEGAIAEAFKRYAVVGFFADGARWESQVAEWEAKYRHHLKVKASPKHPIRLTLNPKVNATFNREFLDAVLDRHCTHDGSYAFSRHVLNARRRGGGHIGKETDDGPKKIDAAVAATYAWQARTAAVAAGLGKRPASAAPRRLR